MSWAVAAQDTTGVLSCSCPGYDSLVWRGIVRPHQTNYSHGQLLWIEHFSDLLSTYTCGHAARYYFNPLHTSVVLVDPENLIVLEGSVRWSPSYGSPTIYGNGWGLKTYLVCHWNLHSSARYRITYPILSCGNFLRYTTLYSTAAFCSYGCPKHWAAPVRCRVRCANGCTKPWGFAEYLSPTTMQGQWSISLLGRKPPSATYCLLTLSHPMTPYGVMVSHKLMGIYMGFSILGVIL